MNALLLISVLLAPPSGGSAAGMAQVSVTGIRVVGPGFGENATEIRPFNQDQGITLVLAIKAPQGTGIVSIDDDACVLSAMTDDKGANLLEAADFGGFPELTKDGSVGLLEVTVRGRPSVGTVGLSLQGTIVYTSASGSKPQKVSNVKLAKGGTFKLGKTTMTLSAAEVDGESLSLAITLPRSVMDTIKDLRFLDAKGEPLEGRRTGSGWMNDVAEISYQLDTAPPAATIEFDLWQGMKEQTLPFSIRTGLAMRR